MSRPRRSESPYSRRILCSALPLAQKATRNLGEGMADLDLERIIADLRERRDKVALQMEDALSSSGERANDKKEQEGTPPAEGKDGEPGR